MGFTFPLQTKLVVILLLERATLLILVCLLCLFSFLKFIGGPPPFGGLGQPQ